MTTKYDEGEGLLAKRSTAVEWSGIRNMFTMAKGVEGVISLGIGQPDFDTPKHILEAGKSAMDHGYTRYPPAAGFADLREAIAHKLKVENGITADPTSEIFITIGAMQGIFNTVLLLVNPGDHVLLLDPGYDYYSQIRLFGGIPIPIPVRESNGFRLDIGELKKAISRKTKLIIVNSPSNPTGAMLAEETMREIAEVAMNNNIFVLSDECYEKIIYDGKKHLSIGAIEGMKNLTVSVLSFSKTYAMTGWRIGYVAAPKFITLEMEKLMEHMASGVTAVSQRAALAAIEGSQECVLEMLSEYEMRRKVLHAGLVDMEGVSCVLPEGSFYAFANISAIRKSSWEFATYLLKRHRLAVVPGMVFGRNGEGYVRVSFAVNENTIREGLDRMKSCICELQRLS